MGGPKDHKDGPAWKPDMVHVHLGPRVGDDEITGSFQLRERIV